MKSASLLPAKRDFIAQRFHPPKVDLSRRQADFIEKSTCICKCFFLERVTGIEPAWPAWEAGVLPLDYTRVPVYYIPNLPFCQYRIEKKPGVSVAPSPSFRPAVMPFDVFPKNSAHPATPCILW